MTPTVQWKGDNAQEIEKLLRAHVVRADREGDKCRVIGLGGLSIVLELGDSLILEGDRLGVVRATPNQSLNEPAVLWKGDNLRAVAEFLKAYEVRLDVIGADLFLYAGKDPQPLVLHRGDMLIERGRQIVVSKAGKDHRV